MIVLKIILFILLAVLGIILLLLFMPVTIDFSFKEDKIKYRIKYAFLNFVDSDGGGLFASLISGGNSESSKKNKRRKKKNVEDEPKSSVDEGQAVKETVESSENETVNFDKTENTIDDKIEDSSSDSSKSKNNSFDKSKKKSPGEIAELIIDIWNSAKRPFRKILKGFHLTGVAIDFVVADEDAYKCAMKYGQVCTLLYNGIAHCSNLFTLKCKSVDVECGFGQEKSRWDIELKFTFVPITAVISGAWFLTTYIFKIMIPKRRKAKKSAKKQKLSRKAECEG